VANENELSNHKDLKEVRLQLCKNTYKFAEKYMSREGWRVTLHEGKVRGESAAGGYVQRPCRAENSAATDMFVNLFFKPS
jgi:hypothetical protein